MGKRKSDAAKGSNRFIEKKSSKGIPSFDEGALTALTAKIEQGFEQAKPQQKQFTATGPSDKHGRTKISATASNGKLKPKMKSEKAELSRGVKRDANGIVKAAPKAQSTKIGSESKVKAERAILLKEILALGGTEEDLDLVADAASDEEEDLANGTQPDKSFQKDLAKFVQGLGIEGHILDDASDLVDKAQDDEGWEEDSDTGSLRSSVTRIEEDEVKLPTSTDRDGSKSQGNGHLIFAARPDWHAAPLPDLPTPEVDESSKYHEAITSLQKYSVSLLEKDSSVYASKHLSSSSSHRFLSTIMSSGTLSDKVSALTLVVQESPVHTTKSFESLLSLAKKRSRGQAVTALGALKDLLGVGVVLPADRRLRSFSSQPGLIATLQNHSVVMWKVGQPLPGSISQVHLISWAYEDWLKESYFDMLKILEGWCNDEIEYARSRAVTYVYELLREKPEQEANLLRLLVNKLGDPDKKIASRTSYLLLQLQLSHPLMKTIIVRSIETELLLRSGQSSHAKHYAINTLNQTILSGKEENVAKKLLDIYFELFVTLLKKPDPQKLIDASVTNRKGEVQGGGGPKGKKAQAKAAKEEDAKLAGEETTEKLISAILTGVNRAFPFSKTDDSTLEKHMDTLFRITHSSNFNTSVQALILIEQLSTSKHLSVDRFYRTLYESLLDPRLVMSSKHALYLNLLFRALRSDLNIKRVKAFVKRLLQIVTLHQPPFICGVLYLIRELEGIFPGLKTLLNDPENYDGDGEETFHDVPEDGEPSTSLVQENHSHQIEMYDGRKRDPEHSNADKSCLWESVPFLVHFHPSVSLFADRLLSDKKMPPKPDLASHGLSSFLDRFVYRNAKAAVTASRGGSIMQPLSGGDSKGVLLSNRSIQIDQQPLNTEAFWRKKAEDVAVDEVFFHRYFSQIGKAKQAFKKQAASKAPGESDADEDENEDEIWQALVDSRPEVEGPSDDDESDLDMRDLDDTDAESTEDDDPGEDEADIGSHDMEEIDSDMEQLSDQEFSEDGGTDLDNLFENEVEIAQSAASVKNETKANSREKKRKLKALPTFASAEDYASMLDDDGNEDS